MHLSGVVGYNRGVFYGSNGYSYSQLPKKEHCVTSSITHGSIASTTTNVYYAQEFVGNNYNSDIKFVSFAMGDLYASISEYSSIHKVLENQEDKDNTSSMIPNTIDASNKINIVLPMPKGLVGKISRNDDNSKFVVKNINLSNANNLAEYNVIAENLTNVTIGAISDSQIVSGRTGENGKTTISITANNPTTTYFVNENQGVLSNVYLNCGDEGSANNVALVKDNFGLITNVYVYGLSLCNHTIAYNNGVDETKGTGRIYASASSIKFTPKNLVDDEDGYVDIGTLSDPFLYGLVKINAGMISDCYSSSFGYTEDHNFKTNIYGFANENTGTIQYSTYFIPDVMLEDNVCVGQVVSNGSGENKGKIKSCYSQESMPETLIKRSTIWTKDTSQVRIIGMNEKKGSIVIRVYITIEGKEQQEITGVEALKKAVAKALTEGKKYTLDYKYDFFTDTTTPKYDVVRITNGQAFVDYLSANNYTIPQDTIIMFTDIVVEDKSHNKSWSNEITISGLTKAITVSHSSAIIGISSNVTGGFAGMVLNFSEGEGENMKKQTLMNAFIDYNRGLLEGICIKGLKLDMAGKAMSGKAAFAPILVNLGVIHNVCFDNVDVMASQMSCVTGFVGVNDEGGIIKDCQTNNVYIQTGKICYRVCYKNEGTISNVTSKSVAHAGGACELQTHYGSYANN